MSRVVGIILAAGHSRRLGRPKQLLLLDGQSLVTHVADRAIASSLDEVNVVTGAHADAVGETLAGRNVRIIHNGSFEEGQGTSIAAGVASLGDEVDAAVILLSDQPGILPATIDRVIAARREHRAPVVMAQYGDERGHPVLFGRELFRDLRELEGDIGGRHIVRAHREQVVLVDGGTPVPPPDVDTEEAWAHLQREWSKSKNASD